MTLHFQTRKEDVLAFTRAHHVASPTFRRTQAKVRLRLPAIMLILWIFTTYSAGFDWVRTSIYLGIALLWFFIYPARFARNVERYSEKAVDDGSYSKNFGPCELTLSEAGIESKSPMGESKFYWSSVDRTILTDSYLFIFLNGSIGYPIPISDVGREAAMAAYGYINLRTPAKDDNNGCDTATANASP